MTILFIMQTLIYVISMEFLSLSRIRSPRETSRSGDERRRNVCRSQVKFVHILLPMLGYNFRRKSET